MATIKTAFKPTQTMLDAATALYLSMAQVQLIEPIVLAYQTKILAAHQWVRCDPYNAEKNGTIILDPKDAWLLGSDDFLEFDRLCKESRIAADLHVENDLFCPLLAAEQTQREAKRNLFEIMQSHIEAVTGIKVGQQIFSKQKEYAQFIELSLQLLTPFMSKSR